jgi:hypothetical protein
MTAEWPIRNNFGEALADPETLADATIGWYGPTWFASSTYLQGGVPYYLVDLGDPNLGGYTPGNKCKVFDSRWRHVLTIEPIANRSIDNVEGYWWGFSQAERQLVENATHGSRWFLTCNDVLSQFFVDKSMGPEMAKARAQYIQGLRVRLGGSRVLAHEAFLEGYSGGDYWTYVLMDVGAGTITSAEEFFKSKGQQRFVNKYKSGSPSYVRVPLGQDAWVVMVDAGTGEVIPLSVMPEVPGAGPNPLSVNHWTRVSSWGGVHLGGDRRVRKGERLKVYLAPA